MLMRRSFVFRLVSLNLNGIRSAANKGFVEWAQGVGADCMGVQEVRAQADDVAGKLRHAWARWPATSTLPNARAMPGWAYTPAREPSDVSAGFDGGEFDAEGRYMEARYDTPQRKLSIISCYFPSGSSGEERQAAKYRFLDLLYPHLMKLKAEREFILVGDVNIAHQEIDLKNWKSNQKNSGFLPEERAWMTKLLSQGGLVDVFRTLEPQARAIHLVEQPRPGLGQERRLAPGLSPGHARHRRQGEARAHLPGRSASRTTRR